MLKSVYAATPYRVPAFRHPTPVREWGAFLVAFSVPRTLDA